MNKRYPLHQYFILGLVLLVMMLLIAGVQSGYLMNARETDEALLDSFKAKHKEP